MGLSASVPELIGPVPKLEDYDVSPTYGFLRDTPPIERIEKEYYTPWEDTIAALPSALREHTVDALIEKLPVLDADQLEGELEERRGMLILSLLAHGYIYQDLRGDPDAPPRDRLPQQIAKPWVAVAARVGRPPILSHASVVLSNYKRINPDGAMVLGNVALINQFHDDDAAPHEAWFFLVPVEMEALAGAAYQAIVEGQQAVLDEDTEKIELSLNTITDTIKRVQAVFERMPEQCEPSVFYNYVRIFVSGWKGNPSLPNGLVYEGVGEGDEDVVYELHGGSAAQSSLFNTIDAGLGLKHESEFLDAMLDYQPPMHREFVMAVRQGPSLRAAAVACAQLANADGGDADVRNNAARVVRAYNRAVEALGKFRSVHIIVVTRFIVLQSKSGGDQGTGGSGLMSFLQKVRNSTLEMLVELCDEYKEGEVSESVGEGVSESESVGVVVGESEGVSETVAAEN